MSSTELDYMGITLEVEYDFEDGEPATRWEPGCAAEAIINSICVEGVDITEIIGSDHMARIAERVADKHEDTLVNDMYDRADHEIKSMKELA